LPNWVFPVAGLCVGYPSEGTRITPRLPLQVTVHTNCYSEADIQSLVDAYDRRRHALQPYSNQRSVDRFGKAAFYGWSEDKARQFALPELAEYGAFIRNRGFRLS
jgi:nitroreductase/FMN reductase [NAD(P)H]